MPLPTKCSVQFGKPLEFTDDPYDTEKVAENVDTVKAEIRKMLDDGLANRESIF